MSDAAARIRAARAYAGLKQAELAAELGIDVQTIKRREAGTTEPTRGELRAIATICGVPVSFMLEGFAQQAHDDIVERLERLEAIIVLDDLTPVREYVGQVIKSLEQGAVVPGSPPQADVQALDPRRQARGRPPAQ